MDAWLINLRLFSSRRGVKRSDNMDYIRSEMSNHAVGPRDNPDRVVMICRFRLMVGLMTCNHCILVQIREPALLQEVWESLKILR